MAEVKEPIRLVNPLRVVKDSNVNNVGPTVINFLKKYTLERGKTVTFRLLRKKANPDPEKKAGPFIYPNTTLRTQYWVTDKENGPIEIAAIQTVNRDGSFRIKKFSVDGSSGDGKFVLYGDNVEHQQIFPHLMLSPQNKTSLFYDPNEELYEVIDETGDANKRLNRVGVLSKCLRAIEDMEHEDLRIYNTAFGGSIHDEPEIMRDRLNALALKDAVDFYTMIDKPTVRIKAVIKQASELGVILYDPQQHRYAWVGNGETIASLERKDGSSEMDLFAEWLDTSKNGGKIQKMIEEKMLKK